MRLTSRERSDRTGEYALEHEVLRNSLWGEFCFKGTGELVWAGGAIAARNSLQQGDDFCNWTPYDKASDTLCVAWATAMDRASGDDAIRDFIGGTRGASAAKGDLFHR